MNHKIRGFFGGRFQSSSPVVERPSCHPAAMKNHGERVRDSDFVIDNKHGHY